MLLRPTPRYSQTMSHFQPQATPLDLLRPSYGSDNNYHFQDSAYTGGPILFDTPAFSPVSGTSFTSINSVSNPTQQQPFYAKMDDGNGSGNAYHGGGAAEKDFQEQMARAEQESMKYEPEITVSGRADKVYLYVYQQRLIVALGTSRGRKEIVSCHNRGVRQRRPYLCC